MKNEKSLKKELLDISIKKEYTISGTVQKKRNSIPTIEELEKIRTYYPAATEENVRTYEFIFCNTCTDRTLDELYPQSITTMCEKSIGKSFCLNHDNTQVVGVVYDTYEEDIEYDDESNGIKGVYLSGIAKMYIPVENQEITQKIDSGILNYVSPSFSANAICSICGESYSKCNHSKGKIYNGVRCKTYLEVGEVHELSLVYLGAIRGAQRKKEFGGEYLMDFEKEYKILKPQLEELQTKVEDYEKKYKELNKVSLEKDEKINSLSNVLKVFGEDLTVEKANEINEYSQVGKEARENLVNDILRMDLVINKSNGVETATSYIKDVVNLLGYTQLKAMKEDYEKRYENIPSGRQTADKEEETIVKNNLFEY